MILQPLVENAVKHGFASKVECGSIYLRSRSAEHRLVIEVEDACGGLPEGGVEHFFEAYVQGGRDRSGLGLGLPIVVRSVHALQGHVRVRNLPGKGCVFAIELPESRAGARSSALQPSAAE